MFTTASRKTTKSSNLTPASQSGGRVQRNADKENVSAASEQVSKMGMPLQAKLMIGAKDDPLEKEADDTAQRVLAKPESDFRQSTDKSNDEVRLSTEEEEVQTAPEEVQLAPEKIQSMEDEGGEEATEEFDGDAADVFKGSGDGDSDDEEVQRETDDIAQSEPAEKSATQEKAESASPDFEADVTLAKSGGMPLPAKTKTFMEERFGADFSNVKIHTDKKADHLCKQIGAKAFAIGNHVFFSSGRFQPDTENGRFLLAHELTHVLQQGGGARKTPSSVSVPTISKAANTNELAKKPAITSTSAKVQGGWLGDKLNKYARQVPGYTLITVLVGYNPLLGESVPRTAMNLVGGLMGMIPGGTVLFDKLKESGALQEAFDWISNQVQKLNLTWNGIKDLLEQAWDAMSLIRGFTYNLNIIKNVLGPTVRRIINFGKAIGTKIMELVFKNGLKLVGAPVEKIMGLINKGTAVLGKIFSDPIQFVKNLANAIKLGLQLFVKNIKKHLIGGLIGWLTGALGGAGITLPEKFNLKGIFSLVMQVLGLTYEQLRPKLVKRLGEKTVGRIEKAVEFVQLLVTKGPIALWDKIKEKITEMKTAVMDGIRNWVITKVVTEGITWIIGLLNPAGALLKILKVFYNVVKFFIDRWSQIVDFATSVFDSIGAIASGQLSTAAKTVENTIAKALPVMISFLASLLGLGGISKAIKKIIMKIRKPIDKAVDKTLDWIVKKAKSFVKKAKSTAKKVGNKLMGWMKQKEKVTMKSGSGHTLFFKMISGKPVLMMASTEDKMSAHDKKIKAAVDKRVAELPNSSDALLGKYREYKEERTKLNTEIGQLKKEDKKNGNKDNAKKISGLKDTAKVLGKLLDVIQIDSDGKLDLLPTKTGYAGAHDGLFGKKMTSYPLTRKGAAGSGPSVSNDTWRDLTIRRNGGSSYYVRGHMLNDNVHGPGNDWRNLAPLTVGANKNHLNNIEKDVKTAVNDGETVYYDVNVIYSGSSKNSITNDSQIPQKFKDAGKESDLKRVVAAEKYVPLRFECKAYIADVADAKAGKVPTKNEKALSGKTYASFGKTITVTNDVGALSGYDLGDGGIRRNITHLNLYNPVPAALSGKAGSEAAIKGYQQLEGIGEGRAKDLYADRANITEEHLRTQPYINKFVDKWKAQSAPTVSFGSGDGVTVWSPNYEAE